jgi:hypothetical protein
VFVVSIRVLHSKASFDAYLLDGKACLKMAGHTKDLWPSRRWYEGFYE